MIESINVPKIILLYARPGHGKTYVIKKYLELLNYDRLYIISSSLDDDYSCQFKVQPTKSYMLDINEVDQFRRQDGIKILVMDDVLHIAGAPLNVFLRDLFSTSRHYNLYIIISLQLLTGVNKICRIACHVFICGLIDKDSLELLTSRTEYSRKYFSKKLPPKNFIIVDEQGQIKLLKPEILRKPLLKEVLPKIIVSSENKINKTNDEDSNNIN